MSEEVKMLRELFNDSFKRDYDGTKKDLLSAMKTVCHDDEELALRLLLESDLVINRKKAIDWNDVWNDEYAFAHQVYNTDWDEPEIYEEAEKSIEELEEVFNKGTSKDYFIQKRGFYLFKGLQIAFIIKSSVIQEHSLCPPGEYE